MTRFIGAIFLFGILIPSAASAAEADLDVPFVVQAPMGTWTWPWQDFCEEAVSVMSYSFVTGLDPKPLAAARQMLRLAEFELKRFGYEKDTGVSDTQIMLRDFYGLTRTAIVGNPSADFIKRQLREGNIVVVPAAGKLLRNPHFVQPGPRYHMVLVRGFDEARREFIVNEPGTKFGDGWRYSEAVLMRAMHDLVPGDITKGPKRVLVVMKALDSSPKIGRVAK